MERNRLAAVSGMAIGTLGGLIGLGGAEFRLPVLIGLFRLPTLEAVILNKAMSLIVVAAALLFRDGAVSYSDLLDHAGLVLNLLAGSLAGAWWAAGHAIRLPRFWLDRIVMALLVALAILMLAEHWTGLGDGGTALLAPGPGRIVSGLVAGFGIGMVAALLGVAGGELLIPTILMIWGVDIKLAGSLSLVVSLPTMIVCFARYSRSDAFAILRQERSLFTWMALGSVVGAGVGGLFLDVMPTDLLVTLLGTILLVSAIKMFHHIRKLP